MTLSCKVAAEKVEEVAKLIRAEFNSVRDSLKGNTSISISYNRSGDILIKVAPICFQIMKQKIAALLSNQKESG